MSALTTAILSGTAASLISMVGLGFTPPGRRLINDLVDRFKTEERYGEHRQDMSRSKAEALNRKTKIRLAERANRAWTELKPTADLFNQALRQRQWS
jgi:hypothetical protein